MAALFFWGVLGALIGAFAKSVAWYESDRGWLPCLLVGIAGGVAGGFLSRMGGAGTGFELGAMGLVVVGAAALLGVYQLSTRRSSTSATGGQNRRAA